MTPSLLIGSGDLPSQPLDVTPILNRPIGDLLLKDVEFATALETLRQRTQANIIVRWTSWEISEFCPKRLSAFSIFDASLETSLNAILGGVNGELEFGMSDWGTTSIRGSPAPRDHDRSPITLPNSNSPLTPPRIALSDVSSDASNIETLTGVSGKIPIFPGCPNGR